VVAVGVIVGVSVGVLVAVEVAVGVMVDVGVRVLVGICVGVLVGVKVLAVVGVFVGVEVAVPVAARTMVLVHVVHVTADRLAGAAGLHPALAPPSPAPSGAASTLIDSRERNIATSASFTIVPIMASFCSLETAA
jgi:hypothetical protein